MMAHVSCFFQEAISTVGAGGTNFPLHITVGASWNTTLSNEVASAIALEAHALGIDAGYAPEVSLAHTNTLPALASSFVKSS